MTGEKKYLFFDIDGTIFDDHGNLPDSVLPAMLEARRNGHELFINTGRTLCNRDRRLDGFPLDGWIMGCGTRTIYHGRTLSSMEYDPERTLRLLEIFRGLEIPTVFECDTGLYFDPKGAAHPEIVHFQSFAEKHGLRRFISEGDPEFRAVKMFCFAEKRDSIEKLLLTASGGPFRGKKKEELAHATKEQVLKHPTWNMGQKITVDSASLMNKGLEVIEAKWLYGVSYEQIQVVVHPQSIIHSMIQFRDGAVIAQLGSTDMKLPIQYALTYPDRTTSDFERLDFWNMRDLTFEEPDTSTFKGLRFAYEAGEMGGSMPCVMNAANEIAVGAFLRDEIHFLDIYDVIEETMLKRPCILEPELEELFAEDAWARSFAAEFLRKNKG